MQRAVYVIRNADTPPRCYVGLTANLSTRLRRHNAGRCRHTARYRPWSIHVVIRFKDDRTALRFERYLKSGSGRAFARRHFEV